MAITSLDFRRPDWGAGKAMDFVCFRTVSRNAVEAERGGSLFHRENASPHYFVRKLFTRFARSYFALRPPIQ